MHTSPCQPQDWLGLSDRALPVAEALAWAPAPGCGAVVLFSGMVRDSSPGRPEVSGLEYEAYEEQVVPAMERVVADARRRWPALGRVCMLHRVGDLAVGEVAVVVVASAPHRAEAFEAGRFCIDELKATVPIWKRETWAGGRDWSPDAVAVP